MAEQFTDAATTVTTRSPKTYSSEAPFEEWEERALEPALGREGQFLPKVPADAKTYHTLLRMLVRARRIGEAFDLLKTLRKEKGACVCWGFGVCVFYFWGG